jgi:hypothetical protein
MNLVWMSCWGSHENVESRTEIVTLFVKTALAYCCKKGIHSNQGMVNIIAIEVAANTIRKFKTAAESVNIKVFILEIFLKNWP